MVKRLGELLDELGMVGRIREEMLADPRRAVPVLEHAKGAHGVRNPGAFANSLWRQGAQHVGLPAGLSVRLDPEPELESGPPDLDALEQAWVLDESALRTGLLKLMAAAYTRHGGIYAGLRANASLRGRARGA